MADQIYLSSKLNYLRHLYNSMVNFCFIDAWKYRPHARQLRVETDQFPAFAIHDILKDKVYILDQNSTITTHVIEDYVNKFLGGEILGVDRNTTTQGEEHDDKTPEENQEMFEMRPVEVQPFKV
jgi:hypothetical protein